MVIAVKQILREKNTQGQCQGEYDNRGDQGIFQAAEQPSLAENDQRNQCNAERDFVSVELGAGNILAEAFIHKDPGHFSLIEKSKKAEKQEKHKGENSAHGGVGPETRKAQKSQQPQEPQLGIDFACHVCLCNVPLAFPNADKQLDKQSERIDASEGDG